MPGATESPVIPAEEAKQPAETTSETRQKLKALADKLRQAEAKEVSGAPSNMSRTRMLDVSVIEKMHPESHYRYVNMTDPQKVSLRKDRGYVPVTDEEAKEAGVAARHGNELVLMKCPREEFERRVELQKRVNKERLAAHKAEVQGVAESLVKQLKDQYGLDVPLNRLMVSE